MSDFLCDKSCPNRNSFGYCNLTTCNQIRWMVISEILTDKVSSDCCGSIAGHLTGRKETENEARN